MIRRTPRQTSTFDLARFASDEGGTTAIEYAIIAAGISIVIIGAVWNIGSSVRANFYDKLNAKL
jgi:pilus assembly protein Flp/PilA